MAQDNKISFYKFFEKFPDEEAARKYFEQERWGTTKRYCLHCGGVRTAKVKNNKPMPYRCKDCRKFFSVRTKSVLAESNVPLHKWLLAIFLLSTTLKGVSSYKLGRDIGVTQKTEWFLAHRIRKVYEDQLEAQLDSPIEVDETYMGGKYKSMHKSRRPRLMGAGAQDKTAVVGAKSRKTKRVKAKVIDTVSSITLQGIVMDTVEEGSTVYTDQNMGYKGLTKKNYKHEAVNYSVGEFIRDQVHTNGIESFWSMLKRGYVGVYHQMAKKHLQRYVDEYVGRHNGRQNETMEQISHIVQGMLGKRLTYKRLTS